MRKGICSPACGGAVEQIAIEGEWRDRQRIYPVQLTSFAASAADGGGK